MTKLKETTQAIFFSSDYVYDTGVGDKDKSFNGCKENLVETLIRRSETK